MIIALLICIGDVGACDLLGLRLLRLYLPPLNILYTFDAFPTNSSRVILHSLIVDPSAPVRSHVRRSGC
jgi:hypothetical protein